MHTHSTRIAAAALLLMAALGSIATTARSQPAATAVTNAHPMPKQLVGCWQRHVGALPVGTAPGIWEIEVSKTGRLDAYTPGSSCGPAAGDFTASVSVAANRFTIGAVPVCASKGVYSWRVSGRSLTLRALADKACPARLGLFAGIWKKT